MAGNDLHADALNPGFMAAEVDVQASETRGVMAGLASQSKTLQGRPSLLLKGHQPRSQPLSKVSCSNVFCLKQRTSPKRRKPPFKPWELSWLEFHRLRSEEERPNPEYHWLKHRLNDPKRWKGMTPCRAALSQTARAQA